MKNTLAVIMAGGKGERLMPLTGVDPYFNMYGRHWPIRTFQRQFPPVKTVFAQESGQKPRVGKALDSLVAHGSIHGKFVLTWKPSQNQYLKADLIGKY